MNKDFENDFTKSSDIPENVKKQSEENTSSENADTLSGGEENRKYDSGIVKPFEDISGKEITAPDSATEHAAQDFEHTSGSYANPDNRQPSQGYESRQNSYGAQYTNANSQYGNPVPGSSTVILGTPTQGYIPPQNHKPKKQKRPASRTFVAGAVCICIVLSALFGIGGAYVGSRLNRKLSGTTSGSDVTINYSNGSTEGVKSSENTVMSVTEKSADTVVEITTETVSTSQYYGQYVTEGAGSGVIIDSSGYIVTCAHVIGSASKINVTLRDGKEYSATLIGSDSQTDIAVIKIDADSELSCAVFGNSDNLIVGQDVVAIGNPLGKLGGTVTNGIISALGREVKIDGQSYTLLQTNAAINPGNSGGGLFDADGNLVGVVNAKSSGDNIEGLGFAIPSNVAVEITQKLIKDGYITGRPKLGVSLIAVTSTSDYMKYWQYSKYFTDYGVYIIESESDKFQIGDRVVAIDGTTVSSVSDITALISNYSVGDEIKVTISRIDSQTQKSKIEDISIVLSEKTKDE